MYESLFGFKEKPFNLTPDPRYLYLSPSHREALARLVYGIQEKKGFIVLTGEVGTGKTTLLHTLLEQHDSSIKAAFVFYPELSFHDFLLYVLDNFGLQTTAMTAAQGLMQLHRFLIEQHNKGENTVLVIDEAQNLPISLLEEIRMLSNLETSGAKVLQIVLVGQPELQRKLRSQRLRQLRQRIGITYEIRPLSYAEMHDYIQHRPQVKVMLAALDPLGLPVAPDVGPGQRADDPLYVPAITRVRASLARRGLLYVGDCKLGALETRAFLQAGGDDYLCPLSALQIPPEVQVGAMILTVPQLEHPVFGHPPVAAGRSAIQADALRLQGIHPQQLLGQRAFNGAPALVVAQRLQHPRQAVITDVQGVYELPGAPTQRLEPLLRPGRDMVQPMIGLRQNMLQPEHAPPAQAEAPPVAVGGKVLVQQGLHPHALQLGQQQWDVIDAFTHDGKGLGHTESLPQCSQPL